MLFIFILFPIVILHLNKFEYFLFNINFNKVKDKLNFIFLESENTKYKKN